MLGQEIGDHPSVELAREVTDLEREPSDPRHLSSIRARGGPATPVLDPVEMDERHVRTEHLVPLLVQEACGDRGVDTSGHGDEHGPLGRHALKATGASGASRAGLHVGAADTLST